MEKNQEMETITTISTLLTLICTVVVIGFIRVVNWVWVRPKRMERWLRQQGIPGTSYRLLVGDLKDDNSMRSEALKRPLRSVSHSYLPRVEPLRHHLTSQLGKDFFMWAGPIPMVTISRPELFREAFTKIHEFQKPKLNPISDKVFSGFASYEGQRWAKHRRIIKLAFHLEKLKLMLPAFYDSCSQMIGSWEKAVAETGFSELDICPYLTALSADAISRASFGSSYKEGQKIFELLKEQTVLALTMLQSLYIPGLRYMATANNRRFRKLDNQIRTLLKGIIDKRKQAIVDGEIGKADLLGILMSSDTKEIQQSAADGNCHHNALTMQEVIDECKTFYIAGQETTSILLVWTLILLSKHQDWQVRAREEVLQTFGYNVPDFEGLNHLKTVTMILNEVLRLYPPATQLSRAINKDTKLGDLTLPAGSLVNFQVLFIHRDKELWGDDAEAFKPERFAEGISNATKGNVAFFPFGWGPRICIGEKFSMIEAKMALSMILQHFAFELSPSYAHAPRAIMFFLHPQHGAQIILHKLPRQI